MFSAIICLYFLTVLLIWPLSISSILAISLIPRLSVKYIEIINSVLGGVNGHGDGGRLFCGFVNCSSLCGTSTVWVRYLSKFWQRGFRSSGTLQNDLLSQVKQTFFVLKYFSLTN